MHSLFYNSNRVYGMHRWQRISQYLGLTFRGPEIDRFPWCCWNIHDLGISMYFHHFKGNIIYGQLMKHGWFVVLMCFSFHIYHFTCQWLDVFVGVLFLVSSDKLRLAVFRRRHRIMTPVMKSFFFKQSGNANGRANAASLDSCKSPGY